MAPATNFPGGITAGTAGQAAAIADAAASVAAPTKAEFDAVVAKLNSLLAVARAAGLIAL